MFNFENWFLCQFSYNTWFFLCGGSLNTPKIGKRKKEFTNIKLRGCKTKKPEGVVFHRQNRSQNFRFYKCYDICFCSFCEKHPLIRKKRFLSLKKIFSKYLTLFFGCCRWPNIWFMILLSLSPSFSSAPSSTDPFFIYLKYLHAKKWWTRLKFPSEIFGCGENERQRSEILNVIAPIALIP